MARFWTLVLALALPVAFTGACKKDPPIMQPKEGELPPLPPASGTAIGYLVDNASTLELTDDQLKRLKELDDSLAARNDVIDTQLRQIERPEDQPPPEKGQPPQRFNNAPGAQVKTTPDAAKLHEARRANDKEALDKAFAVLEPAQREKARQLLDERGISAPGATTKSSRGREESVPKTDAAGVPHEP